MSRRHLRLTMLAAGLLGAASIALLAAPAVAQGATVGKPRDEVESVPGDYIQLDTIWVPVRTGGQRPRYMGMVVRLYPAREARYDACVTAPAVTEHILTRLNQHPLALALWEDTGKLGKLITALVDEAIEAPLYTRVEVLGHMEVPDEESALLTLTCR